ncbi:MAG: protease inhibitor I42 family protein [Coriobacteriia bacterium]|nr:protease inhibitor I42 family protein [Coriobacteriia bacterium]
MRKMRSTVVFLIVAVLVMICATTLVGCKKDKQFTVKLDGNPTTGFEWTYTMEPDGIVKEVSNDYTQDAAPPGYTGVGGTYTWVFEGVEPGKATLVFEYARSWEDDPPADTVTYTLTVDDDLRIIDNSLTK